MTAPNELGAMMDDRGRRAHWQLAALAVLAGGAGACGHAWAKPAVVVPSAASAREVRYEPAPAWVRGAPALSKGAPPAEAPLKVNYLDNQVRVAALGNDVYTAYSLTILKPEGLAAGNVALTWSPAGGGASVHYVRIVRGGVVSDVLAARRFQTIQRESGLEAARIDGRLTAALQVPGLRVGDTLEVALTVHNADPTLGARAALSVTMPQIGTTGAYRTEFSWPVTRAIKWQTTSDLGTLTPVSDGGYKRLTVELNDPPSPRAADGAPLRYNLHRVVQISEYAGWEDVSRAIHPLFEHAAQLEPASPLKAEIARIAAASADPAERARLALKLVQDDVRYVYVGLNGGNYRPMMADDAWGQRLGDCKAKTVLLLALLNGLGIAAEPVLVPSGDGDNSDMFLPSPDPFDHVIIRAAIAGKGYFLDGTRIGDARLVPFQPPSFRYALPLRAGGAPLERIAPKPTAAPLLIETIDIDYAAAPARATDAPVVVHHILRGDRALVMRAQLGALSAQDAQTGMRTYWKGYDSWIEPATMDWAFDDAHGALKLKMTGTARGVATITGPRTELTIPEFVLSAPEERKRPPEQDSAAPWLIGFPDYRCYVANIHLPPTGNAARWEQLSPNFDRALAGVRYVRRADLRDGVLRAVMITRADRDTVTAAEIANANTLRERFETDRLRVFSRATVKGFPYPSTAGAVQIPLVAKVDWTAPETVCSLSPSA